MLEAGREEKQIALDNDRTHQDIPGITVIFDWLEQEVALAFLQYKFSDFFVLILATRAEKRSLGLLQTSSYTWESEIYSVQHALLNKIKKSKVDPLQHVCFENWTRSSRKPTSLPLISKYLRRCMVSDVLNVIGDGDSSVLLLLHNIRTTVLSYGRLIKLNVQIML